MPTRPVAVIVPLAFSMGCRAEQTPEITVVVDRAGPGQVVFEPESHFAEYIELPGDRHEIRLTLAEHEEISCDHFAPPGDDEAVVTVTIMTPPKQAPAPGQYAWSGVLPGEPPLDEPVAIPKVQLGSESFVLPAGGGMELSVLMLEPHGQIEGLLHFEFPGDAAHGATQIAGRFVARFCRFASAPDN